MNKLSDFLYKKRNNNFFIFIDKLFYRIVKGNILAMAGSLSFFSLISIFPFVFALLSLIGSIKILDYDPVYSAIGLLPKEIGRIVYNFIQMLEENSSGGFLSLSLFLGLWSASSGIKQILWNVNKSYGTDDNRNYFLVRLMAMFFTVCLMIMVFILTFTQIIGETFILDIFKFFKINWDYSYLFSNLVKNSLPLIYIFIIFIVLYYFGINPYTRSFVKIKNVMPGALFTSISLIFITFLFGRYLNTFASYSVTYGSLGSLLAFFIWTYLMSIIILIGSEINGVFFSMKNFKSQNLWPRHDSFMKKFL